MFSFFGTSASPPVQLDLPREIDGTAVPAVHADMLERPSRYQGQCLDDAHAYSRRIRDEKAKAAALEPAVQYPQHGDFLGLADQQIWEDNVILYRRVRVLEMQVLEMQFVASTTLTIEEEMAVLKAERDALIVERDELLRLDEKHTNDYFILDEEKTQVEKMLRAERRSSRHDAFKYHMELKDMKHTVGNLLDEAINSKSQATLADESSRDLYRKASKELKRAQAKVARLQASETYLREELERVEDISSETRDQLCKAVNVIEVLFDVTAELCDGPLQLKFANLIDDIIPISIQLELRARPMYGQVYSSVDPSSLNLCGASIPIPPSSETGNEVSFGNDYVDVLDKASSIVGPEFTIYESLSTSGSSHLPNLSAPISPVSALSEASLSVSDTERNDCIGLQGLNIEDHETKIASEAEVARIEAEKVEMREECRRDEELMKNDFDHRCQMLQDWFHDTIKISGEKRLDLITNYFTEKQHRTVLKEAFRAEKDAMAGQLEHYKMRVSTLEAVNQRDKDTKDATDALHQLTVDCLLNEKKELQSRIRGLEEQSLASCASSTEQCNAIQAELDGLRRLEEVRSIDSAARREEHLRLQSKLDWEKYRRRDDFLLTYAHLIDVDEVIATYEDQREIALKEILYYRALFDDVYCSVDTIREEVLIPPGEFRCTETVLEFVASTASLPFGDGAVEQSCATTSWLPSEISFRSPSSSTPELEFDYDEQSSLDSLSPTLDRYLRFEHEGKPDLVLDCDDVDPVDFVATDGPLSCNVSPLLHIATKAPRETDHDEMSSYTSSSQFSDTESLSVPNPRVYLTPQISALPRFGRSRGWSMVDVSQHSRNLEILLCPSTGR
ncbi:hypothetical protein BDN67DRAFT_807591 [Paxillus ammoniavirescens]|nr:hypothetical protein BDN67DRAFT_807591 [Paxillus ammoniavirescens]